MEGSTLESPEDPQTCGIVALAAQRLFDLLAEDKSFEYRVTCSLFEIHRDKVRDLLDETGEKTDLAMREDMGGDVQIADLTEVDVTNVKALIGVYVGGIGKRVTARTGLNEVSSRGHCCLQVKVRRVEPEAPAPTAPTRQPLSFHVKPPPKVEGKLTLIDLAGFEDNRQTENVGERMHESRTINTSHFTLGKCFLSLKRGEFRVPYRDNKLTRLLGEAFQGKSALAIMLVTVCPNLSRFQAVYNTFTCIQLQGIPVGTARAAPGSGSPRPTPAVKPLPKREIAPAARLKEQAPASARSERKDAKEAPVSARSERKDPPAARTDGPARRMNMARSPKPELRKSGVQGPPGSRSPQQRWPNRAPAPAQIKVEPSPEDDVGQKADRAEKCATPTTRGTASALPRPRITFPKRGNDSRGESTSSGETTPTGDRKMFFRPPPKRETQETGTDSAAPFFRSPASATQMLFPEAAKQQGDVAAADEDVSHSRDGAPGDLAREAASVVAQLAPLHVSSDTVDNAKDARDARVHDENTGEEAVLRLLNGTKPELQSLKHIGEQRAELIVQFREQNGPLTSIDQLQEIGLKAFNPRGFLDANLERGVSLSQPC
jgi:DNA uptake protein ComE-like DNA-binding protein